MFCFNAHILFLFKQQQNEINKNEKKKEKIQGFEKSYMAPFFPYRSYILTLYKLNIDQFQTNIFILLIPIILKYDSIQTCKFIMTI